MVIEIMDNTKELVITRVFDASRERVWRAWTDPAELAVWWGPQGVTTPECAVDVRVGGALRIVMLAGSELGVLAGQRWPMQGVFQEVVEPDPSNPSGEAKLVFTNQAIDEGGTVLIDGVTTVSFMDYGGKTKMTLTTTATAVAPQAKQMIAGMEAGWTQSIDKLEQFVQK